MKNFVLKTKTGNFNLIGQKCGLIIRRGDRSQNYLFVGFSLLLTLLYAIIANIPDACLSQFIPIHFLKYFWLIKSIIYFIIFIVLFWLCFLNNWFRNKIISVLNAAATKEEKR